MKCVDCHTELTTNEREYYEFRCEICEDQLFHRIQNWREGGEDVHLNLMFNRGKNNEGEHIVH